MEQHPYQIVITDCDHLSFDEEEQMSARIGAKLSLAQVTREEDLIKACQEADGLIIQYALLTRKVLERLPKCKVISRYGVGVDTIDIQAATDLGIIVAKVPDYWVDEVADQTLSLILGWVRKQVFFDQKIKTNQWDFQQGRPIHRIRGKILGLIGCGKMGVEVARRISAFGVRVIAFDPYLKKPPQGIELFDFDTVLKDSDFLSIHCPLNESTHHLIDGKALGKMEKKPLLINTSRGPIVDERALIQALAEGQVSGAGLDVLEEEPPDPQNPLLKMENVILSPHVSFYSEESIRELKRRTAENVVEVLMGKWPKSVVNRNVMGRTRAPISE